MSNQRKKQRLSPQNSQRQQARMYIYVGISCMALTISMVAVMHFTSTRTTQAQIENKDTYRILDDQVFTIDMSLRSPQLNSNQQTNPTALFAKQLKADTLHE